VRFHTVTHRPLPHTYIRTHVQNNNVREDGLVALGLALPHNTHLQSLSLFGNDFSHRTGEVPSTSSHTITRPPFSHYLAPI